MTNLREYTPSLRPEDIPEGYVLCDRLGSCANIEMGGLVSCTVPCPYGSQTGAFVSWEGEKESSRPICATKGLVAVAAAMA
ncbi:MAG: hypothetical protein WC796_03025 [Candidatus Pacearchaeota archaeon]|jgi:hypothetical protein